MLDSIKNTFVSIGDWFTDKISSAINSIILDWVSSIFDYMFKIMYELVFHFERVDQYINYKPYLQFFMYFAGFLILVRIAFRFYKIQQGVDDTASFDSLQALFIDTIIGILLIFLLDDLIVKILMPINQKLIDGLIYLFSSVSAGDYYNMIVSSLNSNNLTVLILQLIIFTIGVIVISVQAGIRFVEILIGIITAPLIATHYIADKEKVYTWFNEMISIVFTQSLQVLLLLLMMTASDSIKVGISGYITTMIYIGFLFVAVKSPQILRQNVYKTGIGGAGVSALGQLGKYKVMRSLAK
ncbi:MAG: conjugal transfer protein TrbL family protein [Vulcanibacillus sp.]